MRRQPLKGIDPLKVFMHARGFHLAESYLANIDFNQNPQLALEIGQAQITLSALNSELFFKCLICLETGLVPPGHMLDELFDQLSQETQEKIEHIWASEIVPLRNEMWEKMESSVGGGQTLSRDFRDAIRAGSRAFEEVRYSYEPNGESTTFYISDLPRLLWRVIVEKRPEWKNLRRKVHEVPSPDQKTQQGRAD